MKREKKNVQWSGYGELGNISQKPLQPTAEGAEKIAHDLDELIERLVPINAANFEFCVKQNIVNGGLLQGIRNVATLHAQKIADKMVSERWINVKDGLPMKDGKSSIYCLVNSEYDGIVVRPYNEYHKCWDTEDADDYYCDAVGGKITHWMPLPNPPIK